MKKFYILVAMVLFTGYIFAQSLNRGDIKLSKNSQTSVQLKKSSISHERTGRINDYTKKNKSALASRWYNYGATVQTLEGPEGNLLYPGLLFPDTTVLIQYSDGTGTPFLEAAAVVLDPLSEVFTSDTELNLTSKNTINVDSLLIFGYYRRHLNQDDVVDTLIVEVLQYQRWFNYMLGLETQFDTDTLFFASLGYDTNLNYTDPGSGYTTPLTTYKILLTKQSEADTTDNGLNYIFLKCDQDNEFRKIGNGVAMTMRFKPGYTWIPNSDIVNTQLNEFSFYSYEENGTNTYNKYRSKNDMNSSQIVNKFSFFNPSDSWYGNYIPSYAYGQSFVYENHYVSFHIVSNNVGITENADKSIKLSQNTPNPADNSTMISYELKQANNVNIVITDLTGKKVMEIKEGKQMSGVHNLTLNTSSLSNGLYYYTLNADNTSLTKKMIVNK